MSLSSPIRHLAITLTPDATPILPAVAVVPAVPVDAMCDIAAGLAHIDRCVPPSPDRDEWTPRSLRLIATRDYDVWLITWPPGSEIGCHDHEGATSVVRLVSGSLVEFLGARRQTLHPGASVVTPPHTAHRLHNPQVVPATSLHVYSPPLTAVTYLDPGPSMSLHPSNRENRPAAGGQVDRQTDRRTGRITPIRSRRAEATSARDLATG
jgi:mannose-6-phosphate isomerase-like protein (cupin superfamily)